MRCPTCKGKSEAIDSRQLAEHRYRRYRCLECGQRFSTGEFVVAIGNRTGGHPVEKWLTKVRGQGAAHLVELIDALLTTWREHGPPHDPRKAPEGIQAAPMAKPVRLALAEDSTQRPDDRRIE